MMTAVHRMKNRLKRHSLSMSIIVLGVILTPSTATALDAETPRPSRPTEGGAPPLADKKQRSATHNDRGLDLYKQGKFDDAIAELSRAIKLNPSAVLPYYNRGNAYMGKRAYELAIADYSEAIRLNPIFPWALMNRGIAYSVLGQLDNALADLNKAAQLDPTNPRILYNRGYVYGKRRDHKAAIAEFTRVIELTPRDYEAWARRGEAFELMGEIERAASDYRRSLQLRAGNPKAQTGLRRLGRDP
jgi:tetratricopeptide (TPR) repeat protein